jgi:geranylgeranyl diphosphate synthase, type I
MDNTIADFTAEIRRRLETSFDVTDSPFNDITFWSQDVRSRLKEYALRGKLLRGALVPFAFSLFRPFSTVPSSCYDVGVVMELLQSFLLIHDDIMDQDDLRRGLPAIHAQYERISPEGSRNVSRQYGLSMGICAGDISAFLALNMLTRIDVDGTLKQHVLELVTREITIVGLAQMQDVHHGYLDSVTADDILKVYTYKTGRYTFSLPMQLGAVIAGVDRSRQNSLVRLGERLGRIFQIRDDRLGLLEEAAETGKPVGSDLKENKQTLYRALLFERMAPDDPVRELFGGSTIGADEVSAVRDALERHNVISDVDAVVEAEAANARNDIAELALSAPEERELRGLLEYNLNRTR